MRTYTDVSKFLFQQVPEPTLVSLQMEAARSSETSEQTYYPSECNNHTISLSNIHRESLKTYVNRSVCKA